MNIVIYDNSTNGSQPLLRLRPSLTKLEVEQRSNQLLHYSLTLRQLLSEDIEDCSFSSTSSISSLGFSCSKFSGLPCLCIFVTSCCLVALRDSSNTLIYLLNTDIRVRGAVEKRPHPTDTTKGSLYCDGASRLASLAAMADGLLWLSPPS
ncbi:hypothetical protein KCU89_g92, partial [Aureobasidium melanogenum]